MHNQPQLEQQIHAFRHKNYLLQNSDGNVDLYDATDKMEQEYREFRKIHLSQNILQQKMLLPCGAEGQLDADRRTGF